MAENFWKGIYHDAGLIDAEELTIGVWYGLDIKYPLQLFGVYVILRV